MYIMLSQIKANFFSLVDFLALVVSKKGDTLLLTVTNKTAYKNI